MARLDWVGYCDVGTNDDDISEKSIKNLTCIRFKATMENADMKIALVEKY